PRGPRRQARGRAAHRGVQPGLPAPGRGGGAGRRGHHRDDRRPQAGRAAGARPPRVPLPADAGPRLLAHRGAPSTATPEVEGAAPTQSGVLPRTGSALADLVLAAIALLLTGRVLTRRRGAVVRPLT